MVVLIAKNTVKELQEPERKQAVSAMIWQATKTIRRCSTLLKNIRMKRRWNFIGQPSISKP